MSKRRRAPARTSRSSIYREAFDSVEDGIAIFGADERLIDCNRRFREFFAETPELLVKGVSIETLLRVRAERGLTPDAIGHVEEWLRVRLAQIRDPEGSTADRKFPGGRWARASSRRMPSGGIVIYLSDVTDRYESARALGENRARLRAIVENAPASITLKDREGRYVFVNAAFERIFGIPRDRALGKTASDLFGPRSGTVISAHNNEVMRTGRAAQYIEPNDENDPTSLVVSIKFPVFDADGEVELIGSIASDISAQQQVEAALRDAQARFQAIMDHAPFDVTLKDLEGRYLFVNRAFERDHKVNASDILGKTLGHIYPPEYACVFEAIDREVLARGESIQREVVAPRPDGPITAMMVKFPVRSDAGAVVAVGTVVADVTEQKKMEAHLREIQKMDAVGQLTGGLAHDFNNLLTVIIGNTELLAERLSNDAPSRQLVATTRVAAMRGTALTHRLLAFARRQKLQPVLLDVNETVSGVCELLARTLGPGIAIESRLSSSIWPVMADAAQVETALLNLAINARDAMPLGGTLRFESANVAGLADGRDRCEAKGDGVRLTVADTGVGMTSDILARAVEPFYTTKEAGKGTGLGLSMVYGFMKQTGGDVRIESTPGRGTKVHLLFPRSKGAGTPAGFRASSTPTQTLTGGETILVVEDSPLVRRLVVRQLDELGYTVVEATNAREALAWLDCDIVDIDLLFSDIVMPGGLNGWHLAAEARRIRPEIKLLFTSGFAEEAARPSDLPVDAGALLAKPYQKAELAKAVRRALDGG